MLFAGVQLRLKRFYCEDIEAGRVVLAGGEAHHAHRVLRLKAGDNAELFDGRGKVAQAVIKTADHKNVTLEVEGIRTYPPKTRGQIVIAPSVAKGQRFEWMITKCTELGVDHIAAVVFERTVKQAAGSATLQRYRKLTIAAAKQCGRVFLPRLTGPGELEATLEALKKDYAQARFIFGSANDGNESVEGLFNDQRDVICLVGPEGGLSAQEHRLLRDNGAHQVCINDNILRIETAAVAFAAILCSKRA